MASLAARHLRRMIGRRLSSERKTLEQTFAALRAADGIGLLPFVPAGFPNLETTAAMLSELERAGASAIEVGFPFSDPIADGPVIQRAFSEALQSGVRVADVFRTVRAQRQALGLPLVAMVSFSIVFRRGVERFLEEARDSGFDGIILPDLPPPEAQRVAEQVRGAGLDTVMLVAPTTSSQRRSQIVRLCSGFVYYLAVSGTTGEREHLPEDLLSNVRAVRAAATCPVCVGFGISRAEHVAMLRGVADGAIVGSAIVRQIMQRRSEGADAIAQAAGDLCRRLLSQVT